MKTKRVECINPQVCVVCEHSEAVDKTRSYVFIKCKKVTAGLHLDPDCVPQGCPFVCEHTVSKSRNKRCVAHYARQVDLNDVEKKLIEIDLIYHMVSATREGRCDACRRPWSNPRGKCTCRKKLLGVREAAMDAAKRLGVLYKKKLPPEVEFILGLDA